ncbi:MAG: hypothetical protein R2796_02560 [Chitinophagaceae bacterium]|nr:hypothetical protein [Chitinophagaceae bacterium]HQV05126.1 hypothetical protein [Chitinophagaceae bacterium]
MKKMIIMLAITISTVNAFAGEENVNQQVLNAFKTEFTTAKDVNWTVAQNYYMATFFYNDKYVYAYYNEGGDLLGVSRHIRLENLPISLQATLKNKYYKNYWISDLIEVSKNNTIQYYITLENADKQLVLQSSGSNQWRVYQTISKI